MRWTIGLVCLLTPAIAAAQLYTGQVRVIDGDTLSMTGERIRLLGIDAPEADQTCSRAGAAWECGRDAAALLSGLTDGKQVSCEQVGRDSYDRIVAVCRAGRVDLSETMAFAGFAVALPQFTAAYLDAETQAKARGSGIWSSTFEMPADYRAARPQQYARRALSSSPKAAGRKRRSANQVFFRNCAAARAAGAAPLYRGQPGYRSQMDGDGDGIACEPYRGR